ncbi:undecaprenyl-diphosphate phosphatase [Clostridium saccharoperbutylacetonicum]|uniref:Undecaprenyl-diphosphatase n=1 Tax=Clostridium saccharoperbutylacetonicum N1-4(HMT) TaxID=931276 RepID=M1MA90_9CLOT|nr:undecaprenyl-diphosphate phosphatase [Clostridium saccharoperbutylacetonicum]AGF54859.1 undecaprenyl-diphosphatase UppP [Clostridium saccharoperbutylacetonicum N1-4(HMT)]AQR93780.1 undecaprenyl-diphosphatase [Clostridium saccharoperbutylacetonicum]NRT64436.1 undecaprenyl-diphosphatase [Clostridium saccharoperbutylacetonicum]NSB27807.1 undecaprenyl-diphosphatase [Clostridium saccharoperbutylacetonicum]NSB29480.1 undecaprenyl-diphosphatase [Clostridium saccharoperbutylacetonicum]
MGLDILFIIKAIIMGIVEGITEFIPVSSTGHLILTGSIINFRGDFADMFEVVIQLGAILAVVVLYWEKIRDSVVDFFQYIFTKGKEGEVGFRFGINVIVGTIPAVIFGGILHDKIKKILFGPEPVVIAFLVGGILLIIIENKFRKNKHAIRDIDKITPMQSLKIGLFQCLAMWPGMSRSASTIMGGWVAGLSTSIAAEYSFFLAIPAMVGSSGLDLIKFDYSQMNLTNALALAIGFIVSFIVALIVMRRFINYLKKRPMRVFAVYRIGAGIVFGILIFLKVISV